ncbi:MAG TPA: hypothetical protein VK249_16835 [Anaerolineales bacterium]|nr:hypothetical protein [Anaerolineales bacterium]
MMSFKKTWVTVAIFCLLALGAWLRVSLYGDLNLSIGNPDTRSYVEASSAPAFSMEAFTGRRLFTTNILYKLANDSQTCPLLAVSTPAEGSEGYRAIQPCFNNIVLLQNWISILGWCFLAWTTARWITTPLYKILMVILVLAFGFTPQIAEWDSVLSPESLSLSLFAILLALLQEIIFFATSEDQKAPFLKNGFLVPFWLVILILWAFIRDVHVYALLVTAALTLPLLFLPRFRKSIYVLAVLIFSGVLFAFGTVTSHNSTRWQPSIRHAFTDYIEPFPARVEFFQKLGMPKDRSSQEYEAWFKEKALSSYGKFLILHPGFLVSTIFQASFFEADFVQPYFKAPEVKAREALLIIGRFLHPESYAVYVIDFLLLISVCYTALKSHEQRMYGLAWLAIWTFLYLAISLLLSYFGDTSGTRRHIFPSVEGFRLFGWIYLVINIDLAGTRALSQQNLQSS